MTAAARIRVGVATSAWDGPLGRRRGFGVDRGSIPLALLAVIVASGLTVVVVASTIAGQRSVRFDEDFTEALHVAEAGVHEVRHLLNTRQLQADDSPAQGSGTVGGRTYEWEAHADFDPDEPGPVAWEVTSTGGIGAAEAGDGVTRTLLVTIADDPLFDIAVFSDQLLAFAGANNADSYNSDTQEWCTGLGRVGSNDSLEFKGGAGGQATCDYDGSRTVDGVDLYDWEANEDPDRCAHSTNAPNNCKNADGSAAYVTHDDPVEFNDDVDWMVDLLPGGGDANGCDESLGTVASSDAATAAVSEPGVMVPAESGAATALLDADRGIHAYCVDNIEFDTDTVMQDASVHDPVAFLVAGSVTVDAGSDAVNVNCEGCEKKGGFNPRTAGLYPVAAQLQIFSPSETNPGTGGADVVRIRNHSNFAALSYVPRGSCGGVHGSNASVHVFGSLICSDVRNQGGWQFHFDEAQADAIRTFDFKVDRWSEQ